MKREEMEVEKGIEGGILENKEGIYIWTSVGNTKPG